MPTSNWITGAQLIPENRPYKVDASGRAIIPSHLRAKFCIQPGDNLDYYTAFIDNKWFVCVTKTIEDVGEGNN